jgi:uncharacterized phage protein gp47/JayE
VTDFSKILDGSDIPITEEQIKEVWQKELVDQGYVVNNQSPVSPFWRIVEALITKPAMWLINLAVQKVFPGLFVATALDEDLDKLGWERNLPRNEEVKAYGKVTIIRESTDGDLSIDKDTIIYAEYEGERLNVLLTEAVLLQDGLDQTTAFVKAEFSGSKYNLAAGYYTNFETAIDGVTVTNAQDWLLTAGAENETNDDYRLRIRDQFGLLSVHYIDDVYKQIIATQLGIDVNNIAMDNNAPRGAGTANAYVFANVGLIPNANLLAVNGHLSTDGNHGLGDDVQVFEMPRTTHNIELNVWLESTVEDAADYLLQVENFIRCAFRENLQYQATKTEPWNKFSFSKLTQELHEQFTDLYSLRFTNQDIVSQLNLPTINTINVINND